MFGGSTNGHLKAGAAWQCSNANANAARLRVVFGTFASGISGLPLYWLFAVA